MSKGLLIGSCLLIVCSTACGGPPVDEPATSLQSLLGGELSTPADDAVVEVVAQLQRGSNACTGTLVAPNLVLTARHCITNNTGVTIFECDANGELLSTTGGTMGSVISPENITIRVGAEPSALAVDAVGTRVFSLSTTTMCRNDIALILLDRPLNDLPIMPIRLDRGAKRGEPVLAVGYGLFLEGTQYRAWVRHRRAGFSVTKIGSSQFNPNGDSIPPRSFQTDGGALCIGDSGGPAIANSGAVIGVYSKSNGDCNITTTATWYTETAPFSEELIRPAFVAAGAEPLLELDEGAAGAAGSHAGAAGDQAGASAGTSTAGGAAGAAMASATSAPTGTGGTSVPPESSNVTYDLSPPGGGTCNCTAFGFGQSRSLGLLALLSMVLGRRWRRPRLKIVGAEAPHKAHIRLDNGSIHHPQVP